MADRVEAGKLKPATAFEPRHEISNNVVCATRKASDQNVKLLSDHHLEFLSLTGGCTGSSEPTLVKMPHCWKSYVTTYLALKPVLR